MQKTAKGSACLTVCGGRAFHNLGPELENALKINPVLVCFSAAPESVDVVVMMRDGDVQGRLGQKTAERPQTQIVSRKMDDYCHKEKKVNDEADKHMACQFRIQNFPSANCQIN